MGPFVVASKTAANNEVWACNGEAKKAYESFEAKIKSKATSLAADVVIARAGTLKGGGCGDVTSEEFSSGTGTAKFGLAVSTRPRSPCSPLLASTAAAARPQLTTAARHSPPPARTASTGRAARTL